MEQIIEMVNLMEEFMGKGMGVLVHCLGGKGRSGVILACYIIKNGLNRFPDLNQPITMYPAEALKLLRSMRPISVETTAQEKILHDYAMYLSNK